LNKLEAIANVTAMIFSEIPSIPCGASCETPIGAVVLLLPGIDLYPIFGACCRGKAGWQDKCVVIHVYLCDYPNKCLTGIAPDLILNEWIVDIRLSTPRNGGIDGDCKIRYGTA